MYPHRIRLRGPRECDIAGSPPRRVAMPCNWGEAGLAGYRGAARFTRKFGYPGRIDEGEHVWLTCAGCTGCREIHLNQQMLAHSGGESFAFDATSLLGPRNRLEILIQGDSDNAGLWGEVALEIRRDAYLTEVKVSCIGGGLCITGKAIGISPQPLEMYTLLDNRNADYRTIQPTPEGQPFRIELPWTAPLPHVVRVDLVHISAIWYAVEILIPDWQSA